MWKRKRVSSSDRCQVWVRNFVHHLYHIEQFTKRITRLQRMTQCTRISIISTRTSCSNNRNTWTHTHTQTQVRWFTERNTTKLKLIEKKDDKVVAVTVSYDDKSGKSENDTKENENENRKKYHTCEHDSSSWRKQESRDRSSEGSVALSAEGEAIWFMEEPWIEAKTWEWISRDPQEEDCVATCVEFTWISGTDTDTGTTFYLKSYHQ